MESRNIGKAGGLAIAAGLSLWFAASVAGAGSVPALTDKQQLGSLLYFDTNLSINRNQSCASCHTPPSFSDPANAADPVNSVVSLGSDVSLNGGRNAPTASYAAFIPAFHWDTVTGMFVGGQFWDGRASTLTDQAKGPFLNPVEMAMPSQQAVLLRVADSNSPNYASYLKLWKSVYGVKVDDFKQFNGKRLGKIELVAVDGFYHMLADAIAEFEKSYQLNSFTSKFDYVMAGKAAFSDAEQRGWELYNGQARCNACHTSDPLTAPDGRVLPPIFTDFTYDNIGIPKSTNPMIANNPVDPGLGGRADVAALDPSGGQLGKFKVSSLRNIAISAPYGHNGFFSSLEEIVHFYNARDTDQVDPSWKIPELATNVNVSELGNLGLLPDQEADLVAFLKTLTDGYGALLPEFTFPHLP